MKRFVEGVDRGQSALFPECLDDGIGVFVDELDLAELGFSGVDPEATGRPSYHPALLLKRYIYAICVAQPAPSQIGVFTRPGPPS